MDYAATLKCFIELVFKVQVGGHIFCRYDEVFLRLVLKVQPDRHVFLSMLYKSINKEHDIVHQITHVASQPRIAT